MQTSIECVGRNVFYFYCLKTTIGFALVIVIVIMMIMIMHTGFIMMSSK